MDEVMAGQVSVLHEQMVSTSTMPEPEPPDEQHPMHQMSVARMIRQARFQGGM